MKCDEVKPVCGACARKKNVCEFGRRNTSLPALERTPNKATIDLPTEQASSPVENNGHISNTASTTPAPFEPPETTVAPWSGPSIDANPSPHGQLDHSTVNQFDLNHSPVGYPDEYLSPSNASFAAVRWFGLLANDAARDSSTISAIQSSLGSQSLSLGHSASDDETQLSPLQRATQVLDGPSVYQNHELVDATSSGESPLEKEQIWQSREQIEILPTEATLFEYFVDRVSPWVWWLYQHYDSEKSTDTAQIDLFDPTNQFSTFVAHLAVSQF